MARWTCVIPQFGVRNVPAAQRWYRDVLGLEINWLWEDDFGSVGRDLVELFLFKADDPAPSWCSIFVDDVDAVYEAFRARGGSVESELGDKPWNVREFTARDPDGNCIRVGQNVESQVERAEVSFPS